MLYEQELETLARQLYAELTCQFASHAPAVEVAISGRGIEWHCAVRSRQRSCRIGCYVYKKGPRFYIDFAEAAGQVDRGWTALSSDVQDAAEAWMAGMPYADLDRKFPWLSTAPFKASFF